MSLLGTRYEKRPLGSARAQADRRYYEKNRDKIIARAKRRYEERKLASQIDQKETPVESILESPEPTLLPSDSRKGLSQWIQRLRGSNKGSKPNP